MRFPALILVLLSACSVDHTGLGPDIDASVGPACTNAGDCVSDDPCAIPACNDGVCSFAGCDFGLVCDGTTCVPRSACDPGLCAADGANPARCAIGECRGDLCASVVTCTDDSLCCNEGCVDCPVDETDPCMQPACDGSSCGREPRPAGTPCNVNGNFCEGFGTCDEVGQCTVGLERCGQECDEEADACVGCLEDDDCPPIVTGNNCPAALGDECTAMVTPSRTVFTCSDDQRCEEGPTTDDPVIRCNRENGVTCADSTFPGFGPCEYGSECVLTGVARQNRSDFTCEGGREAPFVAAACTEMLVPLEERDSCDRSTDGRMCSTPPADRELGSCDWMGTCDETATRPVTTYASSCDSGACDPRGSTVAPFMQACNRDRDGNACNGGDEIGDWSECVFTNAMACAGTRTRTITRRMCGSDTCQEMTEEETEDCDRPNADMVACGVTSACMPSGGSNVCIGEQSTPICVDGACSMAVTVPCDLIGLMCAPDEDGACIPNADECMGDRTPVTHACAAGGVCEATNQTPVTCLLTGTPCGDDTICTGGTCNGGTCDADVDCDAMDACMPCMGMGSPTCSCNGANACECL